MSVLSLDPATGYLPRGRHRVTEAEVKAGFVDRPDFSGSTTRSEVWDEYETGRDLLRRRVRIHAIWIGGSFLTSKVDPNDMDALFIVSARDYGKLDGRGKAIVDSFRPKLGPLGKPVRGHGLNRLDSFLLMWFPWSPFDPYGAPAHAEYAGNRGYWDDWWQRDRFNKPDGQPPHWRDAIPTRGYLEVELDAFTR
jgi:hypothetical protein